jgi:hypothetical protein
MTREEAVKMIKDDIRLHHDALSGKYRSALNIAIKSLQQPEQRWIPVSERLPEKNGDYLVTGRKGAVSKRKYDNGRWYGGWDVLAWQTLPEPYKEEGDE